MGYDGGEKDIFLKEEKNLSKRKKIDGREKGKKPIINPSATTQKGSTWLDWFKERTENSQTARRNKRKEEKRERRIQIRKDLEGKGEMQKRK